MKKVHDQRLLNVPEAGLPTLFGKSVMVIAAFT